MIELIVNIILVTGMTLFAGRYIQLKLQDEADQNEKRNK